MKILQVTNAYPSKKHPVHGIFIKEQLTSIKKVGIDYDLIFVNAKDFGKKEYLKAYLNLLQSRNKYDIIHCHHFLVGFLVLLTIPKSKVIISFLSDGTNEFMLPKNFLSLNLIKFMYKWILVRSYARIFKNKIPDQLKDDSLSFHLPNGVNLNLFRSIDKQFSKQKLNLEFNKRYILFCSLNDLYRPEKRYDIFSQAISILKKNPEYQDVEELHLINSEREAVPYYFNAAECYVLTSDFEGSPNAVKECLSTETPVISRNVGDVNILLKNLDGCQIINSANPNKYSEAIKSVLTKNIKSFNYRQQVIDLDLDMESKAIKLKEIYLKVYENNKS